MISKTKNPLSSVTPEERKEVQGLIEEQRPQGPRKLSGLGHKIHSDYEMPDMEWDHAIDFFELYAGLTQQQARARAFMHDREEQNNANEQLEETLSGLDSDVSEKQDCARKFLADEFNVICRRLDRAQAFTPENFTSASFRRISEDRHSQLEELFGPINPCVLVFDNRGEHNQLFELLGIEVSGGKFLDRIVFLEDSVLSKTGLAIARPNERDMYHEKRHQTDPSDTEGVPFQVVRRGINHGLGELFAHYGNAVEGDIKWKPSGPDDKTLTFRTCALDYYDAYLDDYGEDEDIPSRVEYEKKIDSAVDAIRDLDGQYSRPVVEQIIGNSKTLDELIVWGGTQLNKQVDAQLK